MVRHCSTFLSRFCSVRIFAALAMQPTTDLQDAEIIAGRNILATDAFVNLIELDVTNQGTSFPTTTDDIQQSGVLVTTRDQTLIGIVPLELPQALKKFRLGGNPGLWGLPGKACRMQWLWFCDTVVINLLHSSLV